MFECEYCGLHMRGSNLGRHISTRHEREHKAAGGAISYVAASGLPGGTYVTGPDGSKKLQVSNLLTSVLHQI